MQMHYQAVCEGAGDKCWLAASGMMLHPDEYPGFVFLDVIFWLFFARSFSTVKVRTHASIVTYQIFIWGLSSGLKAAYFCLELNRQPRIFVHIA